MLPNWDVQRLVRKIPFVAAAVGGRRQGKSTLIHHLLETMSSRFDLVVSFMGSTACSPEMQALLENKFDPRFVFPEWNEILMKKLLKQQEDLKRQGVQRQVCILVDDIILSGRDEEALAHLCLRGRHFNISVLACAVSYTTLPKRSRRSLDVLFLFSCPMAGDCQILCSEYAHQSRMARYCLQNLPEWTSLVMETLERRQRLYHYKVNVRPQTALSPGDEQFEKRASVATPGRNLSKPRSSETGEHLGNTAILESLESSAGDESKSRPSPSQT